MIVQLEGDTRTRLTGDATLTALLGATTSIYNLFVPPDTALPYIVYDIASVRNLSHFRTGLHSADVRVQWRVAERDNANGYDPVVRGRAIEIRVMGDYLAQAFGTGPTFGLDRWIPALSGSNWSASVFDHQETVPNHTPGVLSWIATFKVLISRTGA